MTNTLNLDDLLIDISVIPLEELEIYARKLYADLFLTGEPVGTHLLHDENQVNFKRGRFKHAFSKADNWQVSKEKTGLDARRIARIQWILPVIQGKVSGSECWLISEDFKKKRLYVCYKEGYIVWLESTNKGRWDFSTAYTINPREVRKYIKNAERIGVFTQ